MGHWFDVSYIWLAETDLHQIYISYHYFNILQFEIQNNNVVYFYVVQVEIWP